MINDKAIELACKPATFAAIKRMFQEGDTVVLKLPVRVNLKQWFSGRAVSVQRGPLVYSLATPARVSPRAAKGVG